MAALSLKSVCKGRNKKPYCEIINKKITHQNKGVGIQKLEEKNPLIAKRV